MGNGNLDQDPLLDGAFIPQSGSPIINMGDPNYVFSDSDGTRNDIGNSGSNGIYVSSTSIDFGNVSTNGACCQNIFIYNLREEAINLQSVTSLMESSVLPMNLKYPLSFNPMANLNLGSCSSPPLGAYSGELGFNLKTFLIIVMPYRFLLLVIMSLREIFMCHLIFQISQQQLGWLSLIKQ